jgi:hypothetical protein
MEVVARNNINKLGAYVSIYERVDPNHVWEEGYNMD